MPCFWTGCPGIGPHCCWRSSLPNLAPRRLSWSHAPYPWQLPYAGASIHRWHPHLPLCLPLVQGRDGGLEEGE
jgi:hypothetical protein